ncbi:MAG: nitrous oxide reductase accessory protein NosL, partial [Campylobacterota bacterium]|nr:nitrous oxide reductase accessory protein NosL [Campylobacterota bacterium]
PKSSKAHFQTVSAKQAILVQKGKNRESCVICGMNLPTFYKTSHAAETKSGTKRQYCSLHCVVEDNEIKKTDLVNLKVVDTNSLKFISVYKAFYVVGSSKPGTMTRTSKYAFAKKSEAEAFAKKFGGKVMNFNDTYTIAMKDSYR